ncbi:MAG: hypothetical protein Q9187_006676 [Circinaria calcarea]
MSNTVKDFGGASHTGSLNPNYPSQPNGIDDNDKIKTAGSISISPEQFEKLFLSPQNKVKGELRDTFANPTPLALLGFLLSLTPLSFDLMGLRGAGGSGAAGIGVYFFMGGLLMLLGAIGEFLLGNTTDPTKPYLGASQPGFYASFAYFLLFMGLLCFIYLIASLRTNMVFVTIFLTLVIAFECLAGAYWQLAQGNTAQGGKLLVVAGGFTFVTSLAGWGDLSTMIKGASQKVPIKDD